MANNTIGIMKKSIVLLFSVAALSSQAALIQFQLSPPGTDQAVGLSPSNQVPVVTNSTGSGDAISGGIVFDTTTLTLHLDIGYGSAAGFSNLTGVPTGMHIHGPAAAGQNAGVLIDLSPLNFTSVIPTNGGVIFGSVLYPTDLVSDLLAGSNYVNIHTALNPGGEIRGQLIPAVVSNAPPAVVCQGPTTVECDTAAEVTALVSDPDGDALTVVWTVNGTAMQTNMLPASNPPASVNVSFSATLPLGTNVIGVAVTDSATNTASCSTDITVVDTTPPVLSDVAAEPNILWPPNHKMVVVQIHARAMDTCGSATWKITHVSSNEAVNGQGDGNTAPDWQITGAHTLKLRAERSGRGGDRTYTITVQAKDGSGNLSGPKTVTVTVPKSHAS
jgi:hypothetical protein